MNLVTCVQMVAGRMKLENHFVTNVKSDMSQDRKELLVATIVVSTAIFWGMLWKRKLCSNEIKNYIRQALHTEN